MPLENKPESVNPDLKENSNLESMPQVENREDVLNLEKKENLDSNNNFENKEEKTEGEDGGKNNLDQARPGASQKTLSYQAKRAIEIDKILSEGMHEVFLNLDAKKQKEFKDSGEDTVKKINEVLDKTKVKVDKIISLIKKWLKLIPGINKFFLEQEAKLKADKIIDLKHKF